MSLAQWISGRLVAKLVADEATAVISADRRLSGEHCGEPAVTSAGVPASSLFVVSVPASD